MSLLLVQGYDSDNDEKLLKQRQEQPELSSSEEEDGGDENGRGGADASLPDSGAGRPGLAQKAGGKGRPGKKAQREPPIQKKGKTGLPSVAFAFQEISGVPDFLRPAALAAEARELSRAAALVAGITGAHTTHVPRDPSGANGSAGPTASAPPSSSQGRASEEAGSSAVASSGPRSVGAALPPKDEAANLARVCPECQVPKTFSSARGGMVCPLCADRPKGSQPQGAKKREGGVKDKEKMKRMKGQSSHASWKSETEMQLRQTYD